MKKELFILTNQEKEEEEIPGEELPEEEVPGEEVPGEEVPGEEEEELWPGKEEEW